MNKVVLFWLCSSAALSLGLLTANASQAEDLAPMPRYSQAEIALAAPAEPTAAVQGVGNSSNSAITSSPMTSALNLYSNLYGDLTGGVALTSDTVGDAAINNSGCDCTGCRNVVLEMIRSRSF